MRLIILTVLYVYVMCIYDVVIYYAVMLWGVGNDDDGRGIR